MSKNMVATSLLPFWPVDLSGTWRAAVATEELRRAYPSIGFDDSNDQWRETTVPGECASEGPILLRRRFAASAPDPRRRVWLEFEGVLDQADVWLDGAYIGDTAGYYVRHTFEVTDAMRGATDHVLAVEVASPSELWVGIWRPVALRETGAIAIRSLRVLCTDATTDLATLSLSAEVDALEATDATLRTTVDPAVEHVEQQRLAAGSNRVAWRVAVESPALWWPHALGDSPLVDIAVQVSDADGESDARTVRTGLRQARVHDWIATVNGERLFLKGAALPNSRAASPDELEREVVRAKDAGLDLLRVGRVGRPELYAAADNHGLLLWQDLPVHAGYARGARRRASRDANGAVDALGHHPSILLWAAHEVRAAQAGSGLALPPVGEVVTDGPFERALAKADKSRLVAGRSGVPTSTDTHFYGSDRELAALASRWPRAVRFVGRMHGGKGRHVEVLRRLKYRPTGGFALLDALADASAPACAPVIVVVELLRLRYMPGERLRVDVHAISDLREPLADATVDATVSWRGGEQSWRWLGDVPADACVRVGQIDMLVPDAPGSMAVEVALTARATKASNRYETEIRAI